MYFIYTDTTKMDEDFNNFSIINGFRIYETNSLPGSTVGIIAVIDNEYLGKHLVEVPGVKN